MLFIQKQLLTCEEYNYRSECDLNEKLQCVVMARESIGELIDLELLIDGRLQEVHRHIELKQEGGKDGVSIEELSNVEESTYGGKREK